MCLLNRKINEATIMPSYRFINEATGTFSNDECKR